MVLIILINMTDCLFYSKNGPIYKYVMEVRTCWSCCFVSQLIVDLTSPTNNSTIHLPQTSLTSVTKSMKRIIRKEKTEL